MCIAMPGKVLSIEAGRARVDILGNTLEVDIRLVDAKPGDRVLVHAGMAIEVMQEDQASALEELLREIGAAQ